MVDKPDDWRWSSYLATIGIQKGFGGLATDAILLQFGKQRNRAIERFREFISQGKGARTFFPPQDQPYSVMVFSSPPSHIHWLIG